MGRHQKQGTRYKTGKFAKSEAERFWEKVDRRGGPDACWPFTGRVDPKGYGDFNGTEETRAHREAWHLTNGSIPRGMNVLHKCDNRPCCNPLHLYLGTAKRNSQDMVARGRQRGGPGNCHGPAIFG